jgi:hypothetical protein
VTGVELAVAGAAVLAVCVLVALVASRRAARRAELRADERITTAVSDLNVRMEAMVRELGGARYRAKGSGKAQVFAATS